MDIIQKPSPNFTKNRQGKKINKIIIHWLGMGTLESANNRFMLATSVASAHYGISGAKVYQWVKDEDAAWHCGNFKVNLESIGIEYDANPTQPASGETYQTSAELIANLCAKYQIPLDRQHILGHKEIKATQCPGTIDIDKLILLAKNKSLVKEVKAPEPLSTFSWREEVKKIIIMYKKFPQSDEMKELIRRMETLLV
jgi:N-acetyl-anhydromuramyl-L-alanine amidase AmpD